MTHRPGDPTPEPPGGRAAERLREFMEQRYPGGVFPDEGSADVAGGEVPPAAEESPGDDPAPGGSTASGEESGDC